MKVLVLGAHADDEILGVGGTIIRHVQEGDDVYVGIMIGKQSTALTVREEMRRKSNLGARYDDAVLHRRKEQSSHVAQMVGIREYRFFDMEDETLEQQLTRTIAAIEDYLFEVQPDIVYTHHRGDSNQDHRGVFKASVVAVRTFVKHRVKRILCYEVLSATEQGPPFVEYAFVPNYYVDISATLARKTEAMRIYDDELCEYPHPRSIEGIITLAKYRGMAAGLKAAEAFSLYREIVI